MTTKDLSPIDKKMLLVTFQHFGSDSELSTLLRKIDLRAAMDNLAIDDLETAFRANLCGIHKQSVEETQEHMEWVAVVLVQIYGKGDADWNDFLDRVDVERAQIALQSELGEPLEASSFRANVNRAFTRAYELVKTQQALSRESTQRFDCRDCARC